jgi:hypothetical protein
VQQPRRLGIDHPSSCAGVRALLYVVVLYLSLVKNFSNINFDLHALPCETDRQCERQSSSQAQGLARDCEQLD